MRGRSDVEEPSRLICAPSRSPQVAFDERRVGNCAGEAHGKWEIFRRGWGFFRADRLHQKAHAC